MKRRGRPRIKPLGATFGRLTVIGEGTPQKNKRGHRMYKCQCECGVVKDCAGYLLRRGEVKSCGCLRRDLMRAAATYGHTEAQKEFSRAKRRFWKVYKQTGVCLT